VKLKYVVIFIVFFVLAGVFIAPLRNYMNNLFSKDKARSEEKQLIGIVSVYNPQVQLIQKILKEAHYNPGVADGVMGAKTRAAIKNFQKDKGLQPTGTVDSKTWDALKKEEGARKKQASVQQPKDKKKQVQIALQKAGFYKGKIDGEINKEATREAVKAFQKAKSLKVDGIVGVRTWAELSEYLKE